MATGCPPRRTPRRSRPPWPRSPTPRSACSTRSPPVERRALVGAAGPRHRGRPAPDRGRRRRGARPRAWARRCSSTTSTGSARTSARLGAALDRAGLRHRLRFALKANPRPPILAALRARRAGRARLVGIDACSPGEVLHALENGWRPEEISYTGTNVSERDLDVLLAHPIRINLDAVSQIERSLGAAEPRRAADRDPHQPGRRRRLQRGPGLQRARPTKFGIYADRLDEAIDVAAPPRPRSTRSTSMPGRAGWPTSCRRSRRRSCRRDDDPTGC